AREKGHHRNGLGPSVKLKCRCQKSLSKARQELNRISAALVVAVWWTGLKPCSIEDDRQGGAGGWTRPATRQAYGWSKLNANHRRTVLAIGFYGGRGDETGSLIGQQLNA